MAIRKVKGGYGVFIDDKKNGKIQRTKKGNIRMKNIKTHITSAKRHMAGNDWKGRRIMAPKKKAVPTNLSLRKGQG